MIVDLDLSVPSYRSAYQLARAVRFSEGREAADRLFCRLLWHVDARDGGLLGLTDAEIEAKVATDPRLNMRDINETFWAPGDWPAPAAAKVAA